MHPDLLQRAATMKGELVAASQTGDGCRWVAFRHFQMFFVRLPESRRFENQRGWFRDGKPVVQARPLASLTQSGKPDAVAQLVRSNVCATQQWHAPDSPSTVHWSERRLFGAVFAGDARRWVACRFSK